MLLMWLATNRASLHMESLLDSGLVSRAVFNTAVISDFEKLRPSGPLGWAVALLLTL